VGKVLVESQIFISIQSEMIFRLTLWN